MEKMDYIYCVLESIKPIIVDMDLVEFGSLFCMLAEEYCKAQHKDVCEFMDEMTTMVNLVNEQEGTY